MYIAAEILGVIAETYTLHLFLQGSYSRRNRPAWHFLLGYGLFLCIFSLLSLATDAAFLRLGLSVGCIFLLTYTFFETKLSQAVLTSLGFMSLYVLSETVSFQLFALCGVDPLQIMTQGVLRMMILIFLHGLFLFLTLLMLVLTKRKRTAITLPFLLALAPGCFAGLLLGISYGRSVLNGSESMIYPFLIAAVGLLYMNILLVFYAERAKASADRQRKMEIAEHHYAMQEQYYANLRCEQEETRAMFHDIHKYMLAMRALVDESNAGKAGEMLTEAQAIFDGLGQVVDVGNPIISVILNEYKEAAEEADVPFDFDVSVPPNLGITAIDAYVLLGNTLDNALEACAALPAEQRSIRLQMKMFHDILFYQVENPYPAGYDKRKKGKNHGYGLQNVRKCVEKYNGDLTTSLEDQVFSLSAHMNPNIPTKNSPT